MAKLPYMKFFPADWLCDTRRLSHVAKSVWMDVVCYGWNEPERGVYRRSLSGFCREHGVTETELPSILVELGTVAEVLICNIPVTEALRRNEKVTDSNAEITVNVRRQIREFKHYNDNALRQARYREKHAGNKKVTPKTSDVKTSLGKKNSADGAGPEIEIPADLMANVAPITDWLEYKRQRRQAYKPKGLEALWRVIRGIPADKVRETVDHSMSNNWSGLFQKNGGSNVRSTTTAGYAEHRPGKYKD